MYASNPDVELFVRPFRGGAVVGGGGIRRFFVDAHLFIQFLYDNERFATAEQMNVSKTSKTRLRSKNI